MPSADTLRWAAYELRREAGSLVPTINGFIDAIGPTVWSGRKADDTRSELELERKILSEVALELESLAIALEQQAHQQDIQQQQARQAQAHAEAEARAQQEQQAVSDQLHGFYGHSVR